MSECTLLLARHGATSFNLQRPFILQGRKLDPDLGELGVRQAEALAGEVQGFRPEAVYSSNLRRASQTAAIVAKRSGIEARIVEALIECDIGEWEGLSWEAVAERYPAEHARFMAEPGSTPYLGGESFEMVRDRALPAIEALAASHTGVVVAVCHNIVNRALLAHWIGIPQRHARPLPQANCGFNVVEFGGKKPVVRTINAAFHLAGLLPPE